MNRRLQYHPRIFEQNTHIALAFDSASGGLMGESVTCAYDAWLANGSRFYSGWLATNNGNDYETVFNLVPSSSGFGGGLGAGTSCAAAASIGAQSLTIVGSAKDDDRGTSDTADDRTAAQVWDANTNNLRDLSIRFVVYYDILAP